MNWKEQAREGLKLARNPRLAMLANVAGVLGWLVLAAASGNLRAAWLVAPVAFHTGMAGFWAVRYFRGVPA
jgi:hypothetical protein